MRGRSSRLLQEQFPELQKKYWGQHLWARGYFCAIVGGVTEEMIRNYIANQGNEEKRGSTINVWGFEKCSLLIIPKKYLSYLVF